MSDAPRWVGWRRPRGGNGVPWSPMPHTEAATRAEVYTLLMDEELKADDVQWEYAAMPLGQTPDRFGSQTYLNRAMRTRTP